MDGGCEAGQIGWLVLAGVVGRGEGEEAEASR